MEKCFLYCAGEYADPYIYPRPEDTVAAIDGGLRLTERLGITPTVVIGDFDSLGRVPDGANVLKYPAEKDDTDSAIACDYCLDNDCKKIYLIGAAGGRPEHTYANLQLLTRIASHGAQGFMFAHDYVFTAVRCGCLQFDKRYTGYISVFSAGEKAVGVNITGLKYRLQNAVITNEITLGVSNEFISQSAEISVSSGTLLIMFERKEALPLPVIKPK